METGPLWETQIFSKVRKHRFFFRDGPSFHTRPIFETFRLPNDSEGSLRVSLGGAGKNEIDLFPGDIATVAPGHIHSYRSHSSNEEIKLIATFSPGGVENLFLHFVEAYRLYLDRKMTDAEYEKEIFSIRQQCPFRKTLESGFWKER
jgi:hypothetical protein